MDVSIRPNGYMSTGRIVTLDEIGRRLRSERERLGLTQTEFGDLGGSSLPSQMRYEKGARRPDAEYLQRIGAAGADVLYIVTGTHADEVDKYFSEVEARLNQESLPITPQHLDVSPELKTIRQKLETIWREPTSTPGNRARAGLILRLAFRHPDAMSATRASAKDAKQLMQKSSESLKAAEMAVGWTPPVLVQQAILTALFSYGLTPDGATAVLQMLHSQAKHDGIWGCSKPGKEG